MFCVVYHNYEIYVLVIQTLQSNKKIFYVKIVLGDK